MRVDLSFQKDRSDNIIMLKNYEYIKSVVTNLFYTEKYSDEYEPNKGLDVDTRSKKLYHDKEVDNEYAAMIIEQFGLYTDIQVLNALVVFENKILNIKMDIIYNNLYYTVSFTSDGGNIVQALTNRNINSSNIII